MKTKETIYCNDKNYDNLLLVVGVAIGIKILCLSLGIDLSDTANHMVNNIAMICK